jgi:hypothetical protein
LNLVSEQVVRLLRVLSGGAMRRGRNIIAIIVAIIAPIIAIGGIAGGAIRVQAPVHSATIAAPPEFAGAQRANELALYMEAYVTGYNTVRNQTDDTPCIAASGANICGRRDTVACPRLLKFGTIVEINGRKYVCADRMAARFRGGFDINCDKDRSCPYEVAGWRTVRIFLE